MNLKKTKVISDNVDHYAITLGTTRVEQVNEFI